jgi:hypothetical protein
MIHPDNDDTKPLSPEQASLMVRARWMSMLSVGATLVGISVVLGIVGYRIFRSEGSVATPSEIVAMLPKGGRLVGIATTAERVIVTIEVQGATEIRSFDARNLQPAGRLRFVSEP